LSFLDQLKAQDVARTAEVQILLDADIAEERDALLAQFETADDDVRLSRKSPAEKIAEQIRALEESAQDALVTFRFRRLPGRIWGELALRFPPRPEVALDKLYGYNIDALCMAAAAYRRPPEKDGGEPGPAYAWRIEDGVEVSMSTEEWMTLFDVIAGSDFRAIADAIWTLNEYGPAQQREAAVKASGATARSAKK
jgi:hypothetical protein